MRNRPSSSQMEQAHLHYEGGNLAEAGKICRQVISQSPRHAEALHLLGLVEQRLGNLDAAQELITESLRVDGSSAAAISNLAGVLKEQGRVEEAIEFYQMALDADSNADFAHSNLGNAFKEQGRYSEAAQCYRRALALNPGSYVFHNNLGIALKELGRYREAEDCYRESLKLHEQSDATYTNLGAVLHAQSRGGDAIGAYLRALELNPQSVTALNNLGNVLKDLGRFSDALTCYGKALRIQPGAALLHNNLGAALNELGRTQEAVASFRRALELKPDYRQAFSNLLFGLNYLPGTDRERLFAEHCRFGDRFAEPLRASWRPHTVLPDPLRPLRVGFVSGDLREHPVAYFMEPVFAAHRREDCEFFVYANQAERDAMSQRMEGLVEHWRNVLGMSDDELAGLIREDAIDILVDLSGHTSRNRLMVFARKPAPVQVGMIGYMQTTGLRAMDYRITDEAMDPPGVSETLNTEELVRLELGASTFRPPADCPPVNGLPAAANGFVTFASFNNLAKVGPDVLAIWARVLAAVPGSKLLVVGRSGNPVRRVLESHGIAPERIELIERQPVADYLKLHHRVDFLLDTFPYTGGTTNILAAWMGVPFVTLQGAGSAERSGAVLLTSLGLPELIAHSPEEYVEKAVAAAADLEFLARCRAGLRGRLDPVLGDGSAFTRCLEKAFRGMWQRWCARQVPAVQPCRPEPACAVEN